MIMLLGQPAGLMVIQDNCSSCFDTERSFTSVFFKLKIVKILGLGVVGCSTVYVQN